MRFIAYIAAVVIAAGSIYFIGNPPKPMASTLESAEVEELNVTMSSAEEDNVSGERLALDVPGMHCAFACFPTVKKTLEKIDGVAAVELAPQKSEDELDDKTVYVTYTGNFQLKKALATLKAAGFEASQIEATPAVKQAGDESAQDKPDEQKEPDLLNAEQTVSTEDVLENEGRLQPSSETETDDK